MHLGDGTWEVFYAPHIARLSASLGTRFEPLRYTFHNGTLVSNVQYSNSLLGQGWLSSAGTLAPEGDAAVKVHFDRFWVDPGASNLRAEPPVAGVRGHLPSWADQLVDALGRAAFIPQIAVFPVLYLDDQLAVFRFPPLQSNIAVIKVVAAPQHAGAMDKVDEAQTSPASV